MLICTKEFVGCFKMNSAGKSSSNEDGFDFFFLMEFIPRKIWQMKPNHSSFGESNEILSGECKSIPKEWSKPL